MDNKNTQQTVQMNSGKIRIVDIADKACVSIGTVDRVLHNRGDVSEETRKRIEKIIDELGYTPNIAAKSLALKKKYSIAVLIPGDAGQDSYWSKPLLGINKALNGIKDFNTGIEIHTFDLGDEKSFLRSFDTILSSGPDGLVFAPVFHESSIKVIEHCNTRNIPYVFIDADIEGQNNLAYFGQDTFRSGYMAARLMDYGIHQKATVLILKVKGKHISTLHLSSREKGFRTYFQEKQLTKNKVKLLSYNLNEDLEDNASCSFHQILNQTPHVRGIFVINSRAHTVAEYLTAHNRNNLLLIGYDLIDKNLVYLEKGAIDFLIGQNPEEQGYKSVLTLFNYLLSGKKNEKMNFSSIDIVMKENMEYYKNFI